MNTTLSLLLMISAASANVAAAQAPPAERTVEIRLEGPEGAAMHEGDQRCVLPCELDLVPGTHRFGLELVPGRIQPTGPIGIQHPGLLSIEFTDRSGARAAGWVVLATALTLAVPAGFIAGLADSLDSESPDDEDNAGMRNLAIGSYTVAGITLLIAAAVGLPLALLGDGTSIRFE